jgi:hypothetical protein
MAVSESSRQDAAFGWWPLGTRRLEGSITSGRAIDGLIGGVLAATTFLVHNVSYALSAPFWIDESWVAVSTRVRLSAVWHVTAVTPLGWTLLLRTMVLGGEQRYRLLPLIFSALTVIAAYSLARVLPWRSELWARLAAVLAGLAVLLAPSSLLRNDLKQYTADAFVTLIVWYLVARLERDWSRKALVTVGVGCLLAFLISAVALFVGVAAFASIVIASLIQRNRRRTVEALVVGVATGLSLGVLFAGLYASHVQASLSAYWKLYYLPVNQGWGPSLHYLYARGGQMATYLGMGPLLLAISLVVTGVVTLAVSGRPALAFAAPILVIEMVVLGAVRKYPLFDMRTSHFLTVTFAVYAAVGVAGLCFLIARRQVLVGGLVAALAAGLFLNNVRHDFRKATIPQEDVRTATAYVAAHRKAIDIIIVSASASEGFSYYWPIGTPAWHPSHATATGFQTSFPDQPHIVVAPDRLAQGVKAAMINATTLARRTPGARIWLVRMHLGVPEMRLWNGALSTYRVHATQVIPCSLLLLTPLAPGSNSDFSGSQRTGC